MADKPISNEQVLALLKENPTRIAAITAEATPAQLRTRPEPHEWSATEILAHLRSCADVWGGCIAKIVAEDRPTFKAVNPTGWIKETDYPTLKFRPSFDAFLSQRLELLAFLQNLPPEAWLRTATVTGAGKTLERTVYFYAQWLARHERTHLKPLASTIKAVVKES